MSNTEINNLAGLNIFDCNAETVVNRVYSGKISVNASNSPFIGYYGILLGIYIDSFDNGVQLAIKMDVNSNEMRMRSKKSGVWRAWG